MLPLAVLVATTAIARAIGTFGVPYLDSWASSTAVGLAAMFVLTGSAHFIGRRRIGLIAMVPRSLPSAGLLVSITGLLELAGAAGLLLPWTRPAAAACFILLLVVMFPANVRAALVDLGPDAPSTPLVPRTAYQVVYIVACIFVLLGAS